jgi:hypothetical protein
MVVFQPLSSQIQTFQIMRLNKIMNCFDNTEEAIETLRLKLSIREHSFFKE